MLLLAQAAAQPQTEVQPMEGAANLVTIFRSQDYPPEAAKKHWQGAVVVDLTVDTDGHVAACNVVRSSGYAVLDDKTCEVFRVRARFQPAKNSAGMPIQAVVRTPPIAWKR